MELTPWAGRQALVKNRVQLDHKENAPAVFVRGEVNICRLRQHATG
jgi:hypothetical protein